MCFYELISALLTAQNIPLIDWSKTTFNNVLLQRVKTYLQALNDGFVVLEPAQNIPLIDWSKTTFNNVILQGDKMNLQALNDGFVVFIVPGVEFLSVGNFT
jgi:hypothetical protein